MQNLGLHSILIRSAKAGLVCQREDGSFPPGHNGPWNDRDTPLRTTAHWSMLMKFAFDKTGEEQFLEAHRKAIHYILQPVHRPGNATFFCRESNKPGKNHCNGLIGQAWILEALLYTHPHAFRDAALEVCLRLIHTFPWSEKAHGWICIETNGGSLGVHRTINQQAWFSAMVLQAASVFEEKVFENRAMDFFSYLLHDHPMHPPFPGLFCHESDVRGSDWQKKVSRLLRPQVRHHDFNPPQLVKSEGYLSFLLYAIAMAQNRVPGHTLWKAESVADAVRNALTTLEQIGLHSFQNPHHNPFLWGYNPTGIEAAFAIQVLGTYSNYTSKSEIDWVQMQMDCHYNPTSELLSENSPDPTIASSRLYEAIRLNDRFLVIG